MRDLKGGTHLRNMTRRIATPIAVAATAILMAASPASAATSSGVQDNFQFSCDASVYITDSLIGSPGRIEAWGGFSCPNPQQWGGVLEVEIYRNGVKVASGIKNSDFTSTNHV